MKNFFIRSRIPSLNLTEKAFSQTSFQMIACLLSISEISLNNFDLSPKDDRKTFALWVKEFCPEDAPYMFALYNNKEIFPLILRREFG